MQKNKFIFLNCCSIFKEMETAERRKDIVENKLKKWDDRLKQTE